MSRSIFEAPIYPALSSLTGDTVRDTKTPPVFCKTHRFKMIRAFSYTYFSNEDRFVGSQFLRNKFKIDSPIISSALKPKTPRFQLVMIPSRSLLRMASSDDSTMAVASAAFSKSIAGLLRIVCVSERRARF
jgi:hypothetical protein